MADVLELKVEPLTRSAFAPFGDVIECDGAEHFSINEGTTERFHDLARVDVSADQGQPLISIFRATPRPLPIAVTMMERHPLASQAFMPLTQHPFLVIVAPDGDSVAPSALRLFCTNGRQGVNYRRNVWHHPVLALNEVCDFAVVDRGGPGTNLEEYFFPKSENITAAP